MARDPHASRRGPVSHSTDPDQSNPESNGSSPAGESPGHEGGGDRPRRRRRRGRRRRRRGGGEQPGTPGSAAAAPVQGDGDEIEGEDGDQSASIAPADGQGPADDQRAEGGRKRRRRRRKRGSRPSTPADIAAQRLGIRELYREQKEIIQAALDGRDVLVILPTGFGKSACYQVPSMVLPKPVVLISPLLALLRDQQGKMIQRDIPSVRLDGTIRGPARRAAMERLAQGGPLLVMTTPETFNNPELREVLRQTGISLVAVDEAHCISEWGHDFRPSYLRLGSEIGGLPERPPILALTATATEGVREDLMRTLDLRDPKIVASTPYRGNLAFSVEIVEGDQRIRSLAKLIKRLQRPGIVYCATTRAVDNLYVALRRLRLPVHHYHGKMRAADREREQTMFMKGGRRTVMIATSAFGLGIDKPDIRYIVHHQSPATLEQYVQEAGRAGRDGRRSICHMLFDPADRDIHEALQNLSRVRKDQVYRIGKALAAWGEEDRAPTMEALALSSQLGPRVCSAIVNVFEEVDLVRTLEDGTIELSVPPEQLENEVGALANRFETIRMQDGRRLDSIAEYARSKTCRSMFLEQYFGEQDARPCGLCDNCRKSKSQPKQPKEKGDEFVYP